MTAAAAVRQQPSPRSFLFVPADRAAELLPKALRSGADAIVLDLEDALDPPARPAARGALAAALRAEPPTRPCFVRVNEAKGGDLAADIEALKGLPIAGLVLPKCEAATVAHIVTLLTASGAGPLPSIIALLETPAGILGAVEIAAYQPAVVGIALGAEDLAARTGMRRTVDGAEILVARSLVVLAASAVGCWAIDTPSLELEDMALVGRDARAAADLGFTGKLLVHPRQVPAVHAAFAPAPDELARARNVIAAIEVTGRGGVARAGSRMIDRPVIEAARRIVARGEQEAKE